jgi:hypothetical protein
VEAHKHEAQTVTHILQDNHFYNQQLNTMQNNMKKKKVHQNINNITRRKNGPCLHIPTERYTITKLLKPSNINTAFRTNNSIKNILGTQPKPNIYDSSRIYQIQYQASSLKYTGQTGRTSHTRRTEHIQNIRNNTCNTGFSQHILNRALATTTTL